ncbi:hypothetical protein [Streptomyces sp. MA15]|uniref:hypothetical protein n=1 Tax=Streptomyces sp. MA15 TaxID=3055061 RepID=UPI0025B17408|nr:hypothetical protein [Streptomyces sp. MA15]MDN3268521.1 hypothetical protein [Streptomyces sp. MA15]
MTQQARRLRARLAALGAVGATALAAAGVQGAAHAADAPLPVVITGEDRVDLSLHSDNGDPTEPQVDLRLDVPGKEFEGDGDIPPVHLGDYTIRIDARGLEGVARADLPCEADGPVAVCTGYDLYAGTTYNRVGGIRLDLADDSESGDTGSIVVTGEGEGLDFTPLTIDVRVGGPELLNRALPLPEDLKAGGTFEPPLGVMNVGGLPSEGAVLRLYGSRGLSFPDDHGNCSSAEVNTGPLLRQHTEVLCTFPDTLDAGAAYALSRPVRVKAADFALHDIFSYSFRPLAPGEEKTLHQGEGRRRGSGPDLTLRRAAGDADPAQYARYAELDLPTTNTYDLELTGASASGAAGDTVTAEIGIRNNGPAWISALRSGGEPFSFTVVAPEGSTVTSAPKQCRTVTVDGSEPGHRCSVATPMLEDARVTFPFELRVDRVVEGAKGRVALPDWDNPFDSDPSNDVAWIVLNAPGVPGDDGTGGSAGAPSDAPSAPGSGDGDGSGDGTGTDDSDGADGASGGGAGDDADGGLALTGAQGVGLLGGAALLALGLGAALVALQRRRARGAGAAA